MNRAFALLGARFAPAAVLLAAPAGYCAVPDARELAHCASIAAPNARLACYDALARDFGAAPAAGTTAVASATPGPAPPAPPAAPAAPAAPPTAAVEDPKNFGLNLAQQHVAYNGIKSEQARILSIGAAEPGQAVVVLDNGQAWKVTDDDGDLSKDSQVTIKRASLGSFLMVSPSHHQYRVRRIS